MMKVDVRLDTDDLTGFEAAVRAAEALGFDGVRVSEIRHDPVLAAGRAVLATRRIEVMTALLLAFPRSPTAVAYAAWDLLQLSEGRFHLGLGSQVRAHVVRRFSAQWSEPVARMRDYVGALRAVWNCWQQGVPLRYEGQFYRLDLMTPEFTPGQPGHPLRLGLGGVSPAWARLCGEIGDRFYVHAFHTRPYLERALLPALARGTVQAGREPTDVEVALTVFVATGETTEERRREWEAVRRRVAFYASTPSYRRVLSTHGWQDMGEKLSTLAREGKWQEMERYVSADLVREVAIVGGLDEIPHLLSERYRGLAQRVAVYMPFRAERRRIWERWLSSLREREQ